MYSEWRSRYPNLPPYEGPVCLALTFWTATRRGRDWDNLAKLFTDALNGDDRQIIEASVHVHRPDQYVLGARGPRKRKTGDPLTWHGNPYQACTQAIIEFQKEYIPE